MALEIFRLVGSVFVDTDKAEESLKKTDKKAGGLGDTLVKSAKTAGKFALGVAGAATAAGGALVAVAESTREYREEQGKLQAAFETSGFSAEAATSTYQALNGVLGDSGQAVEAANHLAMLADNEKELQTWTDICTGVFATFGDSLPIEGLTEAANETAKTGSLTGSLADALNWAGVNEEAFQASLDACSNEQERQALITNTLNGLYTEAAGKYREVNGEVIAANAAQDKLNGALAAVGGAIEPFLTLGKELLANVLGKLTPLLVKLGTEVLPQVTDAWQNTLQPALEEVGTFIKEVLAPAFKWVFENVIVPVVKKAFDGIKSLWKSSLKPILEGIIDFISGVFTGNWSKAWDGVKSIFKGAANGIIAGIETLINGAISAINALIDAINELAVVEAIAGALGSKGIPTLSKIKLPRLEEGGILEKGQIGLLEGNGAEAVVPLHQNKAWISAVAQDMDAAMGGSSTQVVAILTDILEVLAELAQAGIYLDGDALVGRLAKRMDNKLGQLQAKKARA